MFPQELLHDMTYVDAVTEPHKHEMELLSIFMGNTFPLHFCSPPWLLKRIKKFCEFRLEGARSTELR